MRRRFGRDGRFPAPSGPGAAKPGGSGQLRLPLRLGLRVRVEARLPLGLTLWLPTGLPVRVRAVLAGVLLAAAGDESLASWADAVLDGLRDRYSANERTAKKIVAEAVRLFRYLAARGALDWPDVKAQLVWEWCWAQRPDRWGRLRSPSQSTARNCQWAALAAFEVAAALGAPVSPAEVVGERIKRRGASTQARPLTDHEA